MKDRELRDKIIEVGLSLVEEGLVQGTWGNLSARIDENNMLVTPSGLDYHLLTPEDLVVVNIYTYEYTGKNKPTTERKIHAAVYRERPDINSVIHTHSVWCSSLAVARQPLPVENQRLKQLALGDIRVAKYGLPSTSKLTKETIKALKDRNACLMAGHGVMVCGETLDLAFELSKILEKEATSFVFNKVSEITGEKEIGLREIELAFKQSLKKDCARCQNL